MLKATINEHRYEFVLLLDGHKAITYSKGIAQVEHDTLEEAIEEAKYDENVYAIAYTSLTGFIHRAIR